MSFSSEKGQRGWGLRLTLFFALTVSSIVYAADFNISARQTRSVSLGSSGANVDYSLQARFAQNDPVYKTQKVNYSPGRILSLAKARKAVNPAAAAVNAVVVSSIAAAGWVIDELTDQVMNPADGSQGQFENDGTWVQDTYWIIGNLPWAGQQALGPTKTIACERANGVLQDNTCNVANVYYSSNWSHVQCLAHSIPETGCTAVPIPDSEPVEESEWWPLVEEALTDMTPEELREFFNNTNGLPELTPELQESLDEWKDELESQTGLLGEVTEETALDTAQDIQEVFINEDGVDPAPQIDDLPLDVYDPLTNYTLPELPALPIPDIGLGSSSSCETITFSWRGSNVVFPSSSQCSKMNQMKDMMEWLLSVLTLFSCWYIILGQRSAPSV